jgi:BirA family biotin operon repressor/biotin-[acetyl-CoA-carboxylase] ligase
MHKTERINLSKVKDGFRTRVLGYSFLVFRELTSTNEIAKELALRGAREGTVIVAETQTKGRGRLERKWYRSKVACGFQ